MDVEETYIDTTENMKPSEPIVDSQPCSEIITLSDDNISMSPKSVSIPIDETLVQTDRIPIMNDPSIEKPSIIVPSHDNISSVSSSLTNVEGESSTSELSSVSVNIESIETATLETNVDAEVTSNRSSPCIETELVKPTVQQQLDLAKTITNVPQIQEVDILNAEDTQLSAEGYVTFDSISEVGETVESIADEQEPPVLSKVDEVEEFESRDEVGAVTEETVTLDDEAVAESVDVAGSDEPAAIVVTIPEREAEPTPPEVVDNDVMVVPVEEVKHINDNNEDPPVIDSHPPSLNSMAPEEEIEQVESKAEGTPIKRRQSVSSKRNETRLQPEEERHPLESIPEEAVSVDKPPQLQPQLPTENRTMSVDVERRILQTTENEMIDNEEEDDLKSRLAARKQARKRKSISESGETTSVRATRKVDPNEDLVPLGQKELNITIKDLRDNMDPSLEAEL